MTTDERVRAIGTLTDLYATIQNPAFTKKDEELTDLIKEKLRELISGLTEAVSV